MGLVESNDALDVAPIIAWSLVPLMRKVHDTPEQAIDGWGYDRKYVPILQQVWDLVKLDEYPEIPRGQYNHLSNMLVPLITLLIA